MWRIKLKDVFKIDCILDNGPEAWNAWNVLKEEKNSFLFFNCYILVSQQNAFEQKINCWKVFAPYLFVL
jgi:hypothetical protein